MWQLSSGACRRGAGAGPGCRGSWSWQDAAAAPGDAGRSHVGHIKRRRGELIADKPVAQPPRRADSLWCWAWLCGDVAGHRHRLPGAVAPGGSHRGWRHGPQPGEVGSPGVVTTAPPPPSDRPADPSLPKTPATPPPVVVEPGVKAPVEVPIPAGATAALPGDTKPTATRRTGNLDKLPPPAAPRKSPRPSRRCRAPATTASKPGIPMLVRGRRFAARYDHRHRPGASCCPQQGRPGIERLGAQRQCGHASRHACRAALLSRRQQSATQDLRRSDGPGRRPGHEANIDGAEDGAACVLGVIRGLRLPPPSDGDSYGFRYDFVNLRR